MTQDTNTASGAAIRFTKKPITIEAIQWTGRNLREVIAFTDGPPDTRTTHAGMAWDAYTDLVERDGLKIYTLEGKMLASPGDWIIRGVKGELYPCKDEIFEATYIRAALASAPAQPVAEPAKSADMSDEREAFEAWLRSVWTAGYGCQKCDSGKYVHGEAQRFWECWQARASHGQAPAGAGEPTEQQILEAAFAPAQPAVEASRFGSPELQAMIIARCVEKDQADSVREDAARYRWLRDQAHPDSEDSGIAVSESDFNDWGNKFTRYYSGEELDAAIDAARAADSVQEDAARKQGVSQ